MMHKTIKKVTEDIESLDYNTAIAALMEWVNFLEKKIEMKSEKSEVESQKKTIDDRLLTIDEIRNLLLLLAPFAPHMAEELWQRVHGSSSVVDGLGKSKHNELKAKRTMNWSIHTHPWPIFDETLIKTERVLLIVQVDGKFRERVQIERGMSTSDAQSLVLKIDKVAKYVQGKKYKVVYVADKVINFVTK